MDDRHDRQPNSEPAAVEERLELLPFYHDLRNRLVRPEQVHVETRYFFRKWKPRLGPTATLLIMELRDRCYYNPRTEERRDTCWPALDELGAALGVSARTIQRLLDEPLVQLFVKVEHRYRFDERLGRKVRTSSLYHVAMDDPLLPEDQEALDSSVKAELLKREMDLRHQMQVASDGALPDKMSGSAYLPDKMSGSNALDDNLSGTCNDNLSSHEEVPLRDTNNTTTTTTRRMAQGSELSGIKNAMPKRQVYSEKNSGEPAPKNTDTASIRTHYEAANGRAASAIELRLLNELEADYSQDWILAAIEEAVSSGSQFVAPKRIRQICVRWTRDGFKSERVKQSARSASPALRSRSAYIPNSSPVQTGNLSQIEDAMIHDNRGARDMQQVDTAEEYVRADGRIQIGQSQMSMKQLWQLTLHELRPSVSPQHYHWAQQARPINCTEDTLTIGAPGIVCAWLGDHLDPILVRIVSRLLNRHIRILYKSSRRDEV
jgi:hypothetical protein